MLRNRGSKERVPETEVAKLWQSLAGKREPLLTESGERLQVLFPGRPGRGPGPDFRDAVLASPGRGLLMGDVEVHVDGRGWRSHGHHRDPAYNDVVLHVVLRPGGETSASLEMGVPVPVVVLGRGQEDAAPSLPLFPCHDALPRMGKEGVLRALERAGEARFREKARRFRLRLAHAPPEEVLYRSLMEALGYSANREAFRKLALALPMAVLRRGALLQAGHRRRAWLEAALLSASGLGGSEDTASSGVRPCLMPGEWRKAGLRPANYPHRRLQGAAHLVHRFLPRGLVKGVWPLVGEVDPSALLDGLTVRVGCLTPIGPGRAGDMAANAVLPFFYSLVRRDGGWPAAEGIMETYRRLPRLSENDITREVRRRAFGGPTGGPVVGARGQQGMLYLYRRLCTTLVCRQCPLAGR